MEHALDLNKEDDRKVALGHLISLQQGGAQPVDPVVKVREKLIEKAELLSCNLEDLLTTDFRSNLSPEDAKKATHRWMAQCKQLEAKLNVLLKAIENFQLHSY